MFPSRDATLAKQQQQAAGNSSYREKNKRRFSIIISDVKPTTTIPGNKFQETDCINNKNKPKKKTKYVRQELKRWSV